MATVAELLAHALHHHQGGAFAQAEELYRQILQIDGRHVEALYLLGVLFLQAGRPDLAVPPLRDALALRPAAAPLHGHLGLAYQSLGRPQEAVACYRQALALDPTYVEAHNNLGNVLQEQGRLEEARACYHQALALKSDFVEAHNNLGRAYQGLGKLEEALACFRRAVALDPNLAEAHNNLGIALQEQGKVEEAVAGFREALRLKPAFADAHNNLGNVLKGQGKLEEAVACYHLALGLDPDLAEGHNNLGLALQEQGKLGEAVASLQQALRLKPDYAEARNNLGMAWLLLGNFGEGWAEYEWRWKGKGLTMPPFRQPLWDGSPLEGKTILLHAEQGLGDTLQFIRYAPLVQQRGGRVIVGCQKRLLPILSRCPGIDHLFALGSAWPPFDVHAPLLSLPRILGTTLGTIPAPIPYLFADPELTEKWRCRLASCRGLKVGINWRGRPTNPSERYRGIPLVYFEGLARLEGVRLISLQKEHGKEELDAVGDRFPVLDLGGQLDEASGPFMDTAAVMKNLDLVITSDTVLPHLAGALGVPVWLALPFVPDWRWLLEREDSPWYPSMRLFRQSRPGAWAEVFEGIAAALAWFSGLPAGRMAEGPFP